MPSLWRERRTYPGGSARYALLPALPASVRDLLPDTFAKLLITQRFAENSETHRGFFENLQCEAVPSSNDPIFNISVYLSVFSVLSV